MSEEMVQNIIIAVVCFLIGSLITKFSQKIALFFKNFGLGIYKRKIEKKFKIISENTNHEVGIEILPKIKLKIINGQEKINDMGDSLVLYLNKSNNHQDISKILCLVLENNFLIDVRRHIDSKLFASSKYTLGKSILSEDKKQENLKEEIIQQIGYFNRLMNKILQDDDILSLIHKQEILLMKRLFKTVFLHELQLMGERFVTTTPHRECKDESLKFLEFLFNIANREQYQIDQGKEPDLQFDGKYFKLAVILIKKQAASSIVNHIKAIEYIMSNTIIPTIYIMGWGEKNCDLIKKDLIMILDKKIDADYRNKWFRYKELHYKVKSKDSIHDISGICFIYKKV
ncbi:MAG: hypothetical protein P9L89_02060 [Candidatus Celaenobacter polaris]|nr:hypothetical protein [Candidatus Celaenobacter polaris]